MGPYFYNGTDLNLFPSESLTPASLLMPLPIEMEPYDSQTMLLKVVFYRKKKCKQKEK